MRQTHSMSCPYCDFQFGYTPGDGRPCPRCGEILHVMMSSVKDKKILLTQEGYEKIVRKARLEENREYFTERLKELKAAFAKAMKTSTHYGQLGAELEEIVKELLNEHLPLKYYADTGFVRTLEKPGWESKQIDVLLVRRDICFPLAILKKFRVYPIESVIGFMEVTSKINRGKLIEDYEKVVDLKRLHRRHCHIPRPPMGTNFCQVDAPQPRFYYFAFSTDWKKPEIVKRAIKEISREYEIQLHAMFVLDQGCYVSPTPTRDNPSPDVTFTPTMPDSFIGFLYHILLNLQTADFLPPNASIPFQEYFDQGFRIPVLWKSSVQNNDQESAIDQTGSHQPSSKAVENVEFKSLSEGGENK